MRLGLLEIRNLRCIEHAVVALDERCTVIYGENASGKTSLLESIFLLGCGRSFRTPRLASLIQTAQREFLVTGQLHGSRGQVSIGIRGDKEGKQAKLDGSPVQSLAELADALPVQAIDPDVHKLVEEGPIRRRRYIDWGAFHVEHQFLPAWKRYHRLLAQRNASLRTSPSSDASIWNQEMVDSGSILTTARERYVDALQPVVKAFGELLLNANIHISYRRGWREGVDLDSAIRESLPRDRVRGITTVGPHRADLGISVDGVSAKDRVSRGQQKMLAAALLLAQQAHCASVGLPPACLLVDDPAAELDVDNLGKLLRAIAKIPAQLVITSLQPSILDSYLPAKVFHVKQGKVASMA